MSIEDTDYHPSERFGKFTGRRFLIIMILSFGVIMGVNGIFIYEALSTFDGIEADDAYQRGRAYNKDLAAMEAQKALGWKVDLSEPISAANGATHITARFADKQGAPLVGLKVNAIFFCPVMVGADKTELMRETAPGQYESDFKLGYDGNWLIRLAALGPKGEKFAQETRAFVKPAH